MAHGASPGAAEAASDRTAPPASTSARELGDLDDARNGARRESCVKYFDALWFCYSPAHQLREYYRYGNVDDCTGCWSHLYACLKQRTKFAVKDNDAGVPEHPLWKLRTREEAAEFWRTEFGHEREGQASGEVAGSGSDKTNTVM